MKLNSNSQAGTNDDSSTTVEANHVSHTCTKPLVGGWACGVCGYSNGRYALKVNNVNVGHCCLQFIENLSKTNGNNLVQELENQTNYINSLN